MRPKFNTPEERARHTEGIRMQVERVFMAKQSRHRDPEKALDIYVEVMAPLYRLGDMTTAVNRLLLRQGGFPEIADFTAILDVVIEERENAEARAARRQDGLGRTP